MLCTALYSLREYKILGSLGDRVNPLAGAGKASGRAVSDQIKMILHWDKGSGHH